MELIEWLPRKELPREAIGLTELLSPFLLPKVIRVIGLVCHTSNLDIQSFIPYFLEKVLFIHPITTVAMD